MQRLDLYFKVELELDDLERPQRIATELERILRKHYGVRTAEMTNLVKHEE